MNSIPKTNTNGTSISNEISNNSHKLVIELNKDQLLGLTQILKQLLVQKQTNFNSPQSFTPKPTSSNFNAPASPTKQSYSSNTVTQNQHIQLKDDTEEITEEEEYDGAWYTDPINHNNEPIQRVSLHFSHSCNSTNCGICFLNEFIDGVL